MVVGGGEHFYRRFERTKSGLRRGINLDAFIRENFNNRMSEKNIIRRKLLAFSLSSTCLAVWPTWPETVDYYRLVQKFSRRPRRLLRAFQEEKGVGLRIVESGDSRPRLEEESTRTRQRPPVLTLSART